MTRNARMVAFPARSTSLAGPTHLTKHFETGLRRSPMIRAQIVSVLMARIAELGLDPWDLLRAQGIEPGALSQTYAVVDLRRYVALFEAAAELSQNDRLGFEMGLALRPEQIGPLGLLFVLLPTLRDALREFGRLLSALQSETSVALASTDGESEFSYRIDAAAIWPRRQDTEFTFGLLLAFSRVRRGSKWTPRQVEFEHSASTGANVLRRRFGCPVLYEQPTNRMLLDDFGLDVEIDNVNKALIEVLRQHLLDLIGEAPVRGPLIGDVTRATFACMAVGSASLTDVAGRLGLSARSLQRALHAEGWTFRKLLDGCRSDLAGTLDANGTVPRNVVAHRLGYTDATSLSRSRRRWTKLA